MRWKDKINRNYMQISLYVIITAIIIYILSLVAKNAPTIMSEAMIKVSWFVKVIKPVIIGFIFAYLMDPVIDFFEDKYRKIKPVKIIHKYKLRAPRTWATFTSVILLMIVAAGLISLLVFSVTNQMRLANFDDIINLVKVYMDGLNSFLLSVQSKLNELDIKSGEIEKYITTASGVIVNSLSSITKSVLSSVTNISDYLTTFIFSFIIGIYFMIDGKMINKFIRKVCRALFPDSANKRMQRVIHDLDEVFSGYIRGQLLDALFMMIIISLVLSVIGVKFAIVIGILSGIGNLIPYFGPIVAYVSTTVACLINGEVNTWIIALIALLVIQSIDGNLIGPKLLSQSIKIHPLIVIISLIFGSALGGLLGMLLAVPIGAYIKLVFVRFIDHRLEKKKDQPIEEKKNSNKDNTNK